MIEEINFDDVEFGEPIEEREPSYRDGYILGIYRARNIIDSKQKEIKRLNNKINSIFSNIEQFINSYKNDNLDDFFIGLRLSEVVEFYNDLKEVIKSE